MMTGCAEVRQALGVYVVGAIDPAERALVDQHLAGCQVCRDELAGLAGLPALLGRVTLAEVEPHPSGATPAAAPPERLLNSILTEMAARQRAARRRNALLAVAASAVLLAGAGAGAGVEALVAGPAAQPKPPPVANVAWKTASGWDAATGVSAEVRFVAQRWGTEISVWMSGAPDGTRCQVWVTDSAGHRIPIGGWHYETEEPSWYPASTAVSVGSIRSFQITANGKTLISLPAT